MRILLHEFVTGGGWLSLGEPPPASLAGEGQAMRDALAADLATAPGVEVVATCDARWPGPIGRGVTWRTVHNDRDEAEAFDRLAAECDTALVIAPEFDGLLAERCRRVAAAGGRLLGPGLDTIELTADKHATCEHLRRHGVPTPRGRLWNPRDGWPGDFVYPAVWKPRDGAGSLGVRWIGSPRELTPRRDAVGRLESFHAGVACSVALLCGPQAIVPLEPCRQALSSDGRFMYLGGELPLPRELADRARRLARRAVATLPSPRGYLGVDLVLGGSHDGADDVVIEVNPRLTTSYIGLRAAATGNLAAALCDVFAGRETSIAFRADTVRFAADGRIEQSGPARID